MNQKKKEKILYVYNCLTDIALKAQEMEDLYDKKLSKVHPNYLASAKNMLHYLAFRSFDTQPLQKAMRDLGFSSLTSIEAHVMKSILDIREILGFLIGKHDPIPSRGYITMKKSEKLLRKNTKLLFGYKSKKRRSRIMVTLPEYASENKSYVNKLLHAGMNCGRINCAHYDPDTWMKIIQNLRESSQKLGRKCLIAMDLAGPKLRTGTMKSGPKILHVRPHRDDHGRVTKAARFWIAPAEIAPPAYAVYDAILPLPDDFFNQIKRGDTLYFRDARGKKIRIFIVRKEDGGKWGHCESSVYLKTGASIQLHDFDEEGSQISKIGEILPKEQYITLFKGDPLILTRDPLPGENAKMDENGKVIQAAHIACTLPEIFEDLKPGESIFFNDGKIEGRIEKVSFEKIEVRIIQARTKGSKLKADKGINLPESTLHVSGLTPKDLNDLEFVAKYADVINLSFVNSPDDVRQLQKLLKKKKSKAGIILKIETQKAFSQLPEILLTGMQSHPVGIMIARGDLAIETGWKNFASIQQEIMRICEAAHIPDVWATQVLESLAKKGTPSRAEITDAAMAQQAECVMLNKGPYIHKAVRMLDKILRRMQRFQDKTATVLPRLDRADELILSHKPFDV